MWPSLIALVRHGQSVGNTIDRDQRASYDQATYLYPLTQKGREEASYAGRYLKDKYGSFDVSYTSYYTRATETFQCMYPGVEWYEDARLAEGQRGIYHTLTSAELVEKYPEELKRKDREGLYHYRAPGGENWPDMELRAHSFLDMLQRDHAGQKVCVVGHGHLFVIFFRIFHRLSIAEAVRMYHESVVANASVTVYEGDKTLRKVEYVVPWSLV